MLLLTHALSVSGRKGCRACNDCEVRFSSGGTFVTKDAAQDAVKAQLGNCATGAQYSWPGIYSGTALGNCDEQNPELCVRWHATNMTIWRLCGNGGSYTSDCLRTGKTATIISCTSCYDSVECATDCSCNYCLCRQSYNNDTVDLCVTM